MGLDWDYDSLASKSELRGAVITMCRMASELAHMHNRKAEIDKTALVPLKHLERFWRAVDELQG